jgi:hypothetical protein
MDALAKAQQSQARKREKGEADRLWRRGIGNGLVGWQMRSSVMRSVGVTRAIGRP